MAENIILQLKVIKFIITNIFEKVLPEILVNISSVVDLQD